MKMVFDSQYLEHTYIVERIQIIMNDNMHHILCIEGYFMAVTNIPLVQRAHFKVMMCV